VFIENYFVALTIFLVVEPNKPETGLILLAFWNLIKAALVAGPNLVVSLPLEPAPCLVTI
jgi:hypothetical protein